MTTRRWLIAMAVVGIVLGVTSKRRNRFRKIAAHYRVKSFLALRAHPIDIY
jgi:hypothetical protein